MIDEGEMFVFFFAKFDDLKFPGINRLKPGLKIRQYDTNIPKMGGWGREKDREKKQKKRIRENNKNPLFFITAFFLDFLNVIVLTTKCFGKVSELSNLNNIKLLIELS